VQTNADFNLRRLTDGVQMNIFDGKANEFRQLTLLGNQTTLSPFPHRSFSIFLTHLVDK
jgi:hypothetical protein